MAPMAASLIVPMVSATSSWINSLIGKGQEGEFLLLLALRLMMRIL